jgi:3-carboxy-cis,cis-muconate cycloisomerase
MSVRLIECLGTDAEFSDLFSDESVLDAMLRFEVALATAQARIGMIPGKVADAIARTTTGGFDNEALAQQARRSATLVIPFVAELTKRVAQIDLESAGFVHFGATSQDVSDTALVLLLRRARGMMASHHERLVSRLRDLSDGHRATVMLARTMLQPAPPITFGYKAAAWFAACNRGWDRVAGRLGQALMLQFGGASGTLASYGDAGLALAAEMAKELDLPLPAAPWHAWRDGLGAMIAACGIYTATLGKIARDISLLMQPEIGELSEEGGESSAMPNKKNPAGSALVIAAATRVPGLVASFLTGMVQENERAAGGWQAEWTTVSEVIQATGSAASTLAQIVCRLSVDVSRMRANIEATRGSVFAEKASMLLASKLGRSRAQALVKEVLEKSDLREGLAANPEAAVLLTAEEIASIDRPEGYPGGTETLRRRLLGED